MQVWKSKEALYKPHSYAHCLELILINDRPNATKHQQTTSKAIITKCLQPQGGLLMFECLLQKIGQTKFQLSN